MNARERFAGIIHGRPVDKFPVIEWAPWWDKTVDRWKTDGLNMEAAVTVESLQDYWGLDKCLQTWISMFTETTPKELGFGMGILGETGDYATVRKTMYPDVFGLLTDERLNFLELTSARGDTLHFLSVAGFFWFPREILGIERHLYSFYDEPELVHEMCRDYVQWLKELFPTVLSRFRFDFMTFAEDMSYNGGPMISKALFDEFLAPYYREIIEIIHAYGVPVFIDSDGDITQAVDWYASVGADGMLPLERKAGVDVSVYIRKQPQMTFLGHFDKMCMKNGEAAMRAEFERLLPSMVNGKVIPSVDHQTPPDVSMENYRIYVTLLHEYAEKAASLQRKRIGG